MTRLQKFDEQVSPSQHQKETEKIPAEQGAAEKVSRNRAVANAAEVYPLKLTQQQRESMIRCARLKKKVQERLKDAGEGTRIVSLTQKELDHLEDELNQAAAFAPPPFKRRLIAVLRKVLELSVAVQTVPADKDALNVRKTAPKEGLVLYQFRITLLDVKPLVWRRIQVPDCTLADFHVYIQAAFGWWNYHFHQFLIEGERYGQPVPEDLDFGDHTQDESDMWLGRLIPKSGRKTRWFYEYDFGDGWLHEILFEGFPPGQPKAKYPLCLEGARACPPEDCGGPWGYADFLAAMSDPKHELHEELLEWRGSFDPAAFDPKKATREMRKVK